MNDFFKAETSTEAVKTLLSDTNPERGRARKVAEALGCHPTFVSQVALGKAWLNNDQAIAFCRYFQLGLEQTQFFLDLINKDRSASTHARDFFEQRLQEQRESRLNLKERFKNTHSLAPDDEVRYYESWLSQVVHMLCKCEGSRNTLEIAKAIGIDQRIISEVLSDLERMGLISRTSSGIKCTESNIHLDKSSPAIRRLHAVWRVKTLEMMGAQRELPGLHYSSLFSCDIQTIEKLKILVTECIEQSRKMVIDAPSKTLGVFCVDLYPFFKSSESK